MRLKCSNGKVYSSVKEAADELNIPRQNIDRILRKERVTVKGYSFCYENEELRKPRWNTNPRKIKCLETGQIFESAHEASRFFNTNPTFCAILMLSSTNLKSLKLFMFNIKYPSCIK